jgi:hypothetical protein
MDLAKQWPRTAAGIAVPVILLAVGALQWSRRNPAKPPVVAGNAAEKVASKHKSVLKKHKPKSYVRYFVLGLLIRAIEHERSRKAVVGALKLALKRA